MIKIKNGHLMEDWEEATTEKIDDYRIEKSKALGSQAGADQDVECINENWIRTPPNVLFFAI